MIISRSAMVLILACAGISVGVVATSQKTLGLGRELARVQDEIAKEREMIAVLESEWELFTAPPSLQKKLSTTSSTLAPLEAGQIISSAAEIPVPPPQLLIDGPRMTQMVSVDGFEGLVPVPAQKPGIRVRRPANFMLAAVGQAAREAAPTAAPAVSTAPAPAPMPAPMPAPVPVAAQPAPPLADDDDAIGRLLFDLSLARDALAEAPSE